MSLLNFDFKKDDKPKKTLIFRGVDTGIPFLRGSGALLATLDLFGRPYWVALRRYHAENGSKLNADFEKYFDDYFKYPEL